MYEDFVSKEVCYFIFYLSLPLSHSVAHSAWFNEGAARQKIKNSSQISRHRYFYSGHRRHWLLRSLELTRSIKNPAGPSINSDENKDGWMASLRVWRLRAKATTAFRWVRPKSTQITLARSLYDACLHAKPKRTLSRCVASRVSSVLVSNAQTNTQRTHANVSAGFSSLYLQHSEQFNAVKTTLSVY